MAKDIVFRPYLGIATSPLSENAFSLCIDNDTVLGTARINRATINVPKESGESESLTDAVKFSQNYALDSNGGFWKYSLTGGGQWELVAAGGGNGNDFVIWQDYAIVCRGGDIDCIKLSDGSVTADWQTEAGEVMIINADNDIYIGQGNYLRSISAGTGSFNPAIGSTYTYTAQVFDLPSGETVTSLAELGPYMLIGMRSGKVYRWDQSTDSSFDKPAEFAGEIEMLIPVNGRVFVLIHSGDIYETNGSTSSLVRKFPCYILNTENNPSFTFRPNAWRVEGSKIFIGFGSTTSVSPMGIYSYDYKDGDYKVEHIISTGQEGDTAATKVSAIAQYDVSYPVFWLGWKTASTYGIDKVGTYEDDRYSNYTARAYSPLYKIGTRRVKRTIKHWEVSLSEILPDNSSVRVSYRTELNGAWVVVGTFSTAKLSETFDRAVSADYIQIRMEMTSTDVNTPNVLEIRAT